MQGLSKKVRLMQWLLKRRRLITIAGILCICFLIYQLLSLKQLNIDMQSKSYLQTKLSNYNEIIAKTVKQVKHDSVTLNNKLNSQFDENADKLFKCLSSSQQIYYSYVNDDYCDCDDGSDEPLTNACQTNKFYCANKSKTRENSIPSNRVNDGICDCCDGSDEMLNISPPLILSSTQWQTLKSSRMLVRHTPCTNRCPN